MKINYTEETIKKESISVLLALLKDYAVQKREDWRNGEAYQIEIEKIEAEIKRRMTRYEVRVSFLRGEHLKDYLARGYVSSCESESEQFLTREQAEADLQESLEYCEKQEWLVLDCEIKEVEG